MGLREEFPLTEDKILARMGRLERAGASQALLDIRCVVTRAGDPVVVPFDLDPGSVNPLASRGTVRVSGRRSKLAMQRVGTLNVHDTVTGTRDARTSPRHHHGARTRRGRY